MDSFKRIFIFSMIQLCQGELLDGYAFPVYTTEFCPRNHREWNEKSSALNCSDSNAFMCLPDENLTQLLEFCYSDSKIRIQEGICLFLYQRYSLVDAYDCHGFTHGCPNTSHFSDEIYKYPSCVSLGEGCFLSEPFCNKHTLPVQSSEDNNWVRIVISLCIIIVIIATIIIFIKYQRESVSRSLSRVFKGSNRDTNIEFKHGLIKEPIMQITKDEPPQIVVQVEHQGYSLLAKTDNDPNKSDVEDLEKYGVLIFISNDKMKTGLRIKFISDIGAFGQSRYEFSLNFWEPEEDVKLHLFRQPIEDMSYLRDLSSHENHILYDMFKKVTESPKTYFVLYFTIYEWEKYQSELLKYDFFRKAKLKMV